MPLIMSVSADQTEVTPDGSPLLTLGPATPVMVCLMGVNEELTHKFGEVEVTDAEV